MNGISRKLIALMAGMGIGGAVLGSFVSNVVASVFNYGTDHLITAVDMQIYKLRSMVEGYSDVVILYRCDWVTAGNIITLKNQLNEGRSDLRHANSFRVEAVRHNEKRRTLGNTASATVIPGVFGDLYAFRSGFYVYVSEQKSPRSHHSENFIFELSSPKGIKEQTSLTVNVYETNKTANKMADYGNQTRGPTFKIGGIPSYQTELVGGAMIFGFDKDDNLSGSTSSDVLLGWKNSDTLHGLDGDDFISGEQGSNFLYGGAGADLFSIAPSLYTIVDDFDTIIDFSPSDGDVIDITDPVSLATDNKSSDVFGALSVSIFDSHMDIMVKEQAPGQGDVHIVRIMKNNKFNPQFVSVPDLVSKGHLIYRK